MDYGTNADYARTSIESGTSIEDMIAIFLIGIVYLLVMTVYAIFLPLIWVIVLGVSKNQWNDSLGDPRTDRPVVPPAYLQAAPMTQPTSPIQPQTPVVPAPPQQPAPLIH